MAKRASNSGATAGGTNGSQHGSLVGTGGDDVNVDGNFGGVEFHGHGFAHADGGGFGSAIGKKLRVTVPGAAAGEENDFAAIRRRFWRRVEPQLDECLRDEEGAAGIDAQRVHEFIGVEMPEVAGLAELGGGVDDGVEALPFAANFSEERGDGVGVGYVNARRAMGGA